jgi:putative transposase
MANLKNELIFLREVDSIALQQSLRHLDMAFQNFFRSPKVGFPKFKSKKKHRNSYTTNCINGNEPCYPRYYRKAEKRLKREQRKLSLMQKGSKNRDKQRVKVAKLHEKVANQRKDFLHKQSRQITNVYDCVCIENLDMKAMSQALNFGKSVSDNGWGMFTTFLKYKLEEQGKQLIKIDKFFASSQTCSCCGYKNPETKNLSIRAWDCPVCGTHHDRDVNAAINIRNEGMRLVFA